MTIIPTIDYLENFRSLLQADTNNFKASVQKFPIETEFMNRLFSLYQSLPENLDTYPRKQIPILQMYWTGFRCYMISGILVLEAHISESYTLVSKAAESVAVARKLSLHPHLVPKWIKNEHSSASQPFPRILGTLFPKGDKVLSPEIFEIYNLSTNYGRHSNFASTVFFSNFKEINTQNKVYFTYTDLDDEENLRRSTTYLIFVYTRFLKAYREIFKSSLSKLWLKNFEVFDSEFSKYIESFRVDLRKTTNKL